MPIHQGRSAQRTPLPDPFPGEGQELYDVSTAAVKFADTHQPVSAN